GSIRTGRNTGRVDGYDGVVGGARIAGEGDLVGIVRLQKVSPACRIVAGHDVLVDTESQYAVVIAVPVTVGILGFGRDLVPGGNLVGLQQAFFLGLRTKGKADIEDVGSLRALVVLIGANGFQ